MHRYHGLAVLVSLAAIASTHAADTVATPLAVGKGDVTSLSAVPPQVVLPSADHFQQLVITAHHANGGVRDVTSEVTYRIGNVPLVRVDPSGMVVPLANGSGVLSAEFQGRTVPIAVTVTGTEQERPIHFANEIVPILTKFGCNTGACHGKAEGQSGFRLSLLGFDPEPDYAALARDNRGRRTLSSAPERSLLLLKATGSLGHGGGKLLQTSSVEYQLLTRWIASGLPQGSASAPRVIGISVAPSQRALARQATQQIAVTAHWSDGSRSDVTPRAEFRSNDEQLVSVSKTGRIEIGNRTGEAGVMIRYLGQVAVFRATIPQEMPADQAPPHAPNNFVDKHVFDHLRRLGIPPAELCSDGEFLRRAAIDITGTLPTAAEAEKFLADPDPRKREKLVDELLDRPTYASYFALKWGDVLRLRGGVRTAKKDDANKDKGPPLDTEAQRGDAFHAWIKQSLLNNKPYDQFVREIITAQGVTSGPDTVPPILWYLELKTPQRLVDDTAQAFLGTRIQCARCHHHPFEKWSEDDYWGLALYFSQVQWLSRGRDKNSEGPFMPVRLEEGGRLGQKVAVDSRITLTNARGKAYTLPKALDEAETKCAPEDDLRHKLVDWMVRKDNAFFGRALVNRYWAHFLGRGIVEPIDDLRVTNPPSNPELLDALARDFVEHQFDLKHLVRVLCKSKTYQLASRGNEFNQNDAQNFARAALRRLPAEVLLDGIDQVTGSSTEFVAIGGVKFPAGTRAIDLPDVFGSGYFLEVFGKSKRESACECERNPNVTLAQRAHLLNAGAIRTKLAVRAARLAADPRADADKIREAYLACFTRMPTDDELRTVEQYLVGKGKTPQGRNQAYQDFLWALINTKEFVFLR